MRYEHAVESAVVDAVLTEKAAKLSLEAFVAGINARSSEILVGSVESSMVDAYVANAQRAAADLTERITRRDALASRLTAPTATEPLREWAEQRLPQLEAEHIAHSTLIANADVLTDAEGFRGVDFHERALIELDAAWEATKEALALLRTTDHGP